MTNGDCFRDRRKTDSRVTLRPPVLPAGLFGRTFFMNIPEMFWDLLPPPLCRSTWNKDSIVVQCEDRVPNGETAWRLVDPALALTVPSAAIKFNQCREQLSRNSVNYETTTKPPRGRPSRSRQIVTRDFRFALPSLSSSLRPFHPSLPVTVGHLFSLISHRFVISVVARLTELKRLFNTAIRRPV